MPGDKSPVLFCCCCWWITVTVNTCVWDECSVSYARVRTWLSFCWIFVEFLFCSSSWVVGCCCGLWGWCMKPKTYGCGTLEIHFHWVQGPVSAGKWNVCARFTSKLALECTTLVHLWSPCKVQGHGVLSTLRFIMTWQTEDYLLCLCSCQSLPFYASLCREGSTQTQKKQPVSLWESNSRRFCLMCACLFDTLRYGVETGQSRAARNLSCHWFLRKDQWGLLPGPRTLWFTSSLLQQRFLQASVNLLLIPNLAARVTDSYGQDAIGTDT